MQIKKIIHSLAVINKKVIALTTIALGGCITTLPTLAAINEATSQPITTIATSQRPNKLKISYEFGSDANKNEYIKYFQEQKGLEYLASLLESKIGSRLPRQIPIRIRECGTENAFYDPEKQEISICSEFMQYVEKTFKEQWPEFTDKQKIFLQSRGIVLPSEGLNAYSTSEAKRLMYETVLSIFLHESGHMIIHQLNLPVLGREEDAADSFSAYVLLNWLPPESSVDGEKLVGSSIFFWQKSQIKNSQTDNRSIARGFDEHSYDSQRVATFLCALASVPKYRNYLITSFANIADLNGEKLNLNDCRIKIYERQKLAWHKLLCPPGYPCGRG